ncbi:MAG: glycosyltransferase family 1 protein [Candidatus Amesbacteria bacterium]|nr:glycosyltransferase family 1 protein [Candidatus Amesbacteria bacterium]
MLIGIDANEANLTQNRVGINEYAYNLLWAISNLQSEHKFVIYLKTQPNNSLPKERDGWKYRVIPFPKLWTQTRLPWDLFFHWPRPDVFFSMTHYAPRFAPMPTVVSIMDLGFLQTPEQFTTKDFNQLKSWTAYSVRNAKKVMAISDYTRDAVIKTYNKKPEDVITAHLACNPSITGPVHNKSVLKKYGISKPYFIFIGSLRPSKNVDGLIKAFAKLDTKYNLVIVGKKAWLFHEIFKTVADLHLQDRIIFTGFVEEWEKQVLLSESMAYVLPSFMEGFGIPVLEAFTCQTPAVVSAVASLPEVAGDAGIYVEPDDIDSIAAGKQRAVTDREKYVKLGLERVKSFSWAKCAQETLLVLESAV